jgi:hypothetical protein
MNSPAASFRTGAALLLASSFLLATPGVATADRGPLTVVADGLDASTTAALNRAGREAFTVTVLHQLAERGSCRWMT